MREDVGTIDQFSFQAPILPIVFFGRTGKLWRILLRKPGDQSECGATRGNHRPQPYIPCLSTLRASPSTNGAATYGGCSGGGSVTLAESFGLEVPRHFIVPNTQQWNLTVQRDLGNHGSWN